jgi:uncharacterized RDD family membrane protein YckC
MFLFKFIFKKFNPKPRKDNLKYGSNIQRYFSLLSDLLILILLVKFTEPIFLKIFPLSEKNFDIFHKNQMNLKLLPEEMKIINDFKIRFIIFQLSTMITVLSSLLISWYYLGGSIGQILFGLRIINDKNGLPMTNKQMIKRFVFSIINVLTIMIGFLYSLFDKKRQSIHDKISGTVIVTKKSLKEQNLYKIRYDLFEIIIYPILKRFFIFTKEKLILFKRKFKTSIK